MFNSKITICRIDTQIPVQKMESMVEIQRIKIDKIADFNRLENLRLVWYKNKSGKNVQWDDAEATNLELENENDEDFYPEGHRETILNLFNEIKKGLTKDIELISVTDTTIKKEVIIDGVHRAIALFRCFQKEPELLMKLLASERYGIYLINLKSPATSIFFPFDFINFFRGENKSP